MWSSSSIKFYWLCWPMASPADVLCPKALSEHLSKQTDKNPEPCWKSRHCPMVWPPSNGKGHPSEGHWSPSGGGDICSERAGLNFTASGAHSRRWEKPWRSGFINVWTPSASSPPHSSNSFLLFSLKTASIQTPAHSVLYNFICPFFLDRFSIWKTHIQNVREFTD